MSNNQTPLTIQRLMQFADHHDPANEYIEVFTRNNCILIAYYNGLDDADFEEEDFDVWADLNQHRGDDVSIHFDTVEKLKAFISLYE